MCWMLPGHRARGHLGPGGFPVHLGPEGDPRHLLPPTHWSCTPPPAPGGPLLCPPSLGAPEPVGRMRRAPACP